MSYELFQVKNVGWPWYISVLLWFKKSNVSVDDGAKTTFKTLFGKTYIVETWQKI